MTIAFQLRDIGQVHVICVLTKRSFFNEKKRFDLWPLTFHYFKAFVIL